MRSFFCLCALLGCSLLLGCAKREVPGKIDTRKVDSASVLDTGGLRLLDHTAPSWANDDSLGLGSLLSIEQEAFNGADRLISVTVDTEVAVKDLIKEISDLADVDISIDPGIDGRMILKVRDRKVEDVFRQIAKKANVRYYAEDGIVYFVRNDPFLKHYKLDLLNMKRTTSANFDVNTKVLGTGASGGGADLSGAGGSTETIQSGNSDDPWDTVKIGLEAILAKHDELYASVEQYQRSLTNAMSAGGQSKDPAAAGSTMRSTVSLNKQGGIVSVFAAFDAHQEVAAYISKIQRKFSAQVLIEAKVVEVVLSDTYSTGIDWTMYDPNNLNPPASGANSFFDRSKGTAFGMSPDSLTSVSTTEPVTGGFRWKSIISLLSQNSISASLNWLSMFGDTRIVSSPRISATNNQQAVISFVKNSVYFDTKVTQNDVMGGAGATNTMITSNLSIDSSIKTVPVGIILSLQPSIDLERGEISINFRPSVSRIVGNVQNPATQYALSKAGPGAITSSTANASNVPIIEVRTMDSVIKMKNGGIMAIGGLHEHRVESLENGLPVLGKLPFVGRLFKSATKQVEDVETVIIIKATIIEGAHSTDDFSQQRWAS